MCRALATESIELRIFLQKVLQGGKYIYIFFVFVCLSTQHFFHGLFETVTSVIYYCCLFFRAEAEVLRIQADAETSQQELDKLGFNDWVRFYIFAKFVTTSLEGEVHCPFNS